MRTFLIGVATLVALGGCTKTVYLIKNPDGTFTEVEADPHQETEVIVDDTVVVDVHTSNNYLLVEDPDGRLYLQIELMGREVEVAHRAPFNMAIVLDRSGSMRGQKIRDVQAAAAWLIEHMADGDRVSLASYASDVSVDVPSTVIGPRSRRGLIQAIHRMEAGGQTNLAGGLRVGANQVRRFTDHEDLQRVILLSDGNANVGITSVWQLQSMAERLRAAGVTVTTVGVGLDYNEDLMAGVAVAGAGNYYFIEDSRGLAAMFGSELGALAKTVARDAVLELDLPAGVIIEDVYGYRYKRQSNNRYKVFMNSVSAGEKRRVLMSLKAPRGRRGQRMEVARGRLSFRDEVHKRRRSVSLKPVNVVYTSNRQLVARSTNRKVVEKLESVRNAQVKHEALKRLDRGDRAGAARILRRRVQANRKAKTRYGGKALAKEADEIQRFEEQVRTAPAPSSDGYKRMKKANKAKALDALTH